MVRKEMLMVSLMTGGYPIDGKSKEKIEKMHPEIWKRWIAFLAIIVVMAVTTIGYFAFAAQTPAKTTTDASGNPSIGGDGKVPSGGNQPVIGAATPRPTPSATAGAATPEGKEKTVKTEWYSFTDGRKEITLKDYRTTVEIAIGKLGTGSASINSGDMSKTDRDKDLWVNIRFRIKGKNEVFETGFQTLAPYSPAPDIDWRYLMSDKQERIDPDTIEWQAEFMTKDRDTKRTQKVSI